MKKIISLLLVAVLAIGLFAGCGAKTKGGKIVVGASPVPHSEILKVAKEVLAKQGIELEIKEFSDYVLPNTAVQDKSLDANYFQHITYLNNFNAENNTDLVSIAEIHYEPFGIYAGKTKALADLPDGAQVAVPNDTSNEARALLLLEAQGLIKLKEGVGLNATKLDIAENPKNLKIEELEAAQLARSLQDVDIAVINGNYALQAGFNASTDALATESKESESTKAYVNVLAVRKGDENREDLKALVAALKSPEVKKYIEDTYKGAVVPMF